MQNAPTQQEAGDRKSPSEALVVPLVKVGLGTSGLQNSHVKVPISIQAHERHYIQEGPWGQRPRYEGSQAELQHIRVQHRQRGEVQALICFGAELTSRLRG